MNESNRSPFHELRKTVIDQKKAYLPPEAADPDLTELHNAVSLYDQLISPLVIGAIQGLQVDVPGAEIDAARDRVSQALDALIAAGNRGADFYRSYTVRLDRMLALAQQVMGAG